jgi:hypothetical protein
VDMGSVLSDSDALDMRGSHMPSNKSLHLTLDPVRLARLWASS